MIIVDNCIESPGSGRPADSCCQHRRRLHGPGTDESDRQQRPGNAHGGGVQPPRPTSARYVRLRRARRRRRGHHAGPGGGCHPRRQAGGHRRCLPAGALRADRRAGGCDRLGRVRRPCRPRSVPARQRRRADERRNRCHHRPDSADLCREVRASSCRRATATSPACR